MSLMLSSLCVLTLLGHCAQGHDQEPDIICRTNFNFRDDHIYPDSWHLILDSYDYRNLLNPIGTPPPVWERKDVDGTGQQWVQGIGGNCRNPISAATFTTPNQNNWFFTQYNSYDDAIEVIITANFSWFRCTERPDCLNDFVTVHRYDTNAPVGLTQQTNQANYVPVTGNAVSSRLQQDPSETRGDTNVVLRFNRPSNTSIKGFYLGFQDIGTSGSITRFQVYYRIAPSIVDGVLFCPEVPLRRSGDSTKRCSCVNGASNSTSLDRTCSEIGDCTDSPVCGCSPGYELATTTSCQACPAGMYKAGVSNTAVCQSCPTNSEAREPASPVCECFPLFIRNNSRPQDSCNPPGPFRPPTDVRGFCDVVVWSLLTQPGGEIFGYDIRLSNPDTQQNVIVNLGNKNFYMYIVEDNILMPKTSVLVEVRGINAIGSGEWSEPTSLGCVDPPTEEPPTCPDPPTCPSCPTCETCPTYPSCPTQPECPTCETCPTPTPCPMCPTQPECPTCDTPTPCPTCEICPTEPPCPTCETCPTQPECPTCETCPTDTQAPVPGIHFVLRGQVLLNNSAVNLLDIGEGDDALLCVTDLLTCCGTIPNRAGQFYYSNSLRVPIRNAGAGFWRDRGTQHIRLNRRVATTSPSGEYRCEIPDGSGTLRSIFITLE